MPPGRRPKPNVIKLVTGNPGRRKLKPEPKAGVLGPPPTHLTPEQQTIWQELVASAPHGVLTAADAMLLELTVRLIEQSREGYCSPAIATQLRMCLSEMGMAPSARSRLSVPEPPREPNPFFND